jgi:hypothetical protein
MTRRKIGTSWNYEKSLKKSMLGCLDLAFLGCWMGTQDFSMHRPSCSAGGVDVVRHSPGDPHVLTPLCVNGTKPYGKTHGLLIYGCSNLGLFQ